jgi:hypothetical protein
MANIGSWLKQIIDAILKSPSGLSDEEKRKAGVILQERERREKRLHRHMKQLQERTHKRVHPRGPGHR